MCFVWVWKQTATISLYSIKWLVFYNRDGMCLLRGTDWVLTGIGAVCNVRAIKTMRSSGYYMHHQFNIHNSTFCPHSVFMCFVYIWEQTAIISLNSINWLVFIIETECVYCAVRAEFWQGSAQFVMCASLRHCGPVVTICTTSLTFTILRSAHTVYLCVLYGSENKQQLFLYTALTDWFL